MPLSRNEKFREFYAVPKFRKPLFRLCLVFFFGLTAIGAACADSDFPIQAIKSPGGLSAWFSPDPAAKEIAVFASFRDGIGDLAHVKKGLGGLAVQTMAEGAGSRDSVEIKTALEDLGANVRIGQGSESRIIAFMIAKSDKLADSSALFHDILTKPRFGEADITRIRKGLNQQRSRFFAMPQGKVIYVVPQITTPNDPPVLAGLKPGEEVPLYSTADLQDFHKQHFARDNVVIAVAGAITADAAGTLIDDLFADLPAKSNVPVMPKIAYAGQGEIIHVPAESEQSIIVFAGPWLIDGGPDEAVEGAAGDILADYVGNAGAGRLFKKIREEKGLSYGTQLSINGGVRGAQVTISTSVPKDKVAEVVGLIRETLADVAMNGISEAELTAAKERMLASYGRQLTSPGAKAGTMASMAQRGRPVDHWQAYPGFVMAVTKAQVDALAKTYLLADKMTLVIGGPAEGIKPTRVFEVK
jgi:zinc protease